MEEKKLIDEKFLEDEQVNIPVVEKKPINISSEAEKNEAELLKIAPVKNDEALKTTSASKKWLLALFFIAINILAILLTAVIEFIGDEQPINISRVWGTFMENWGWGVVALIFVALAILFEALKRFLLLKNTLKKNMPVTSLCSTIITKYYDHITPLGAGGQPFEIYYLRKKGLPVGIASGVPLVSYSLNKIAYVLVSFIAIICEGFGEITLFIKILCLVGLLVNLLIPVAIVMFAILPKFSSSVAHWIAKVGKKIRLVKDEEAFVKKMTTNFIEYADCIKYFIKKSKLTIIICFLCSIAYYLSMYSLPYLTIRMCGNSNVSWSEMFTYCVICYASITLLPTPGGSGGAELSFRSIFATYLSGGILFWGMLSWRIFSYYSFILFGLILIIYQQVAKFTKQPVKPKKAPEKVIDKEDELELYTPIPPSVKTAEDDINTAEPISLVEATIEPEVEDLSQEDIQSSYVETVVEFTAVIESKSTLTITEEHVEKIEHSTGSTHQITMDELTATDDCAEQQDTDLKEKGEESLKNTSEEESDN